MNKNKELCLINGNLVKCKYDDKVCVYDDREYQNNTIWSPVQCSFCKCENENVNCFVVQCPNIECQNVKIKKLIIICLKFKMFFFFT
jgi:hypothetical protein